MRLTLVISSLGSGGAERVLCRLANFWSDHGHQVTLLTICSGQPFYPLDRRVHHEELGVGWNSSNLLGALRGNAIRIRALRSAIRTSRPHLVVSFLTSTNVLVILATLRMRIPVVVSERIDPFHDDSLTVWRALRRLSYPLATKVVVQTESVLGRMKPQLGRAVTAIPNPVIDPGLRHDPDRSLDTRRWIMGLGRLADQKGFDLLIAAFAQIAKRHPDWSLRIVGEGPLRDSLERKIQELGIEDQACLIGRTKDPYALLAESDLFVLSSRFEGFPNALCEAMACGLPVISFDCPSGPREIIRNGVDGILVPQGDVSGLATAMDSLMSKKLQRREFSRRAPEVIRRFSMERVLADWERVISEVRGEFEMGSQGG